MAIQYDNIKRKLRHKWVSTTRHSGFYPFLYKAFWHRMLCKPGSISRPNNNYFTAIPNRGAGIGHQMANWIAGLWFAKMFNLNFAHTPFSSDAWESLLGFGEGEKQSETLLKKQGYKPVKLPLFDEQNARETERTRQIIASYNNKKVVFVCEQDQFYRDQYGVMDFIKTKFHGAKARKNDNIIYSKRNFNIAVHVRRGDIVAGQQSGVLNHQMRWQDNAFFEKVLSQVIRHVNTNKPIRIYLFSQGNKTDFKEFKNYNNLEFCLDMSAQDSFIHMVFADLLISSKSSFSYKPALLSNGIKVCPKNFWHGYPSDNSFILVEDDGSFDTTQLKQNQIN